MRDTRPTPFFRVPRVTDLTSILPLKDFAGVGQVEF